MAGYQDLKVWQLGIEITREIYALTGKFPREEVYGLTSQLRRGAVFIPSSIAEGHSLELTKEMARFLSIAKGSLAELETQLIIAKQLGYAGNDEIERLLDLAAQEGRMLSSFYRTLTNNQRPATSV